MVVIELVRIKVLRRIVGGLYLDEYTIHRLIQVRHHPKPFVRDRSGSLFFGTQKRDHGLDLIQCEEWWCVPAI